MKRMLVLFGLLAMLAVATVFAGTPHKGKSAKPSISRKRSGKAGAKGKPDVKPAPDDWESADNGRGKGTTVPDDWESSGKGKGKRWVKGKGAPDDWQSTGKSKGKTKGKRPSIPDDWETHHPSD